MQTKLLKIMAYSVLFRQSDGWQYEKLPIAGYNPFNTCFPDNFLYHVLYFSALF